MADKLKTAKRIAQKVEQGLKFFSRENLPKNVKLSDYHLPENEIGREVGVNYRLNDLPDVNYAVKNNQVVGHVGLDDEGSIKTVFVDEAHRRKGVAENMYKQLAKERGELKSDELMAMEPEAISLWEKLAKENPSKVIKGPDGYTMRKAVDETPSKVGGIIAGKIANQLKPNFSLGSAFSAINEPLEKLNEASGRNDVVEGISSTASKIVSGIPRSIDSLFAPVENAFSTKEQIAARAAASDPAQFQEVVQPAIKMGTEMLVPDAQGMVMGPLSKVLMARKAEKAATIAEKLGQAENKGFGKLVVPDAPPSGYGKVTLKDIPGENFKGNNQFGKTTVIDTEVRDLFAPSTLYKKP